MPMQSAAPRRSTMNVCAIRGLGVTQIVMGFLTLALGIGAVASLHKTYWLTKSGGGIWGGLWIFVTGIIGVCSASYPNSGGLNGTHIAFSIISTVIAFIDGALFGIGLWYYDTCPPNFRIAYLIVTYYCNTNRSAGVGIYGGLVTLMAIEFFVALAASIYCCQATGGCCGRSVSEGVVIQQRQPQYYVTTSANPASTGVKSHDSYGYPQQQMEMRPAGRHQQMGNTNVAYSSKYPEHLQYAPQHFQNTASFPAY